MPGRTVVLMTGQALGAVGMSIDLATALQPAMVVLEDVDLVAMDRELKSTNAILFELLNGMDGLDEDHDVMFVLTTNRADLLEPALAARPGRVDEAVELPLPDAEGRRRLITFYGVTYDHLRQALQQLREGSGHSPTHFSEPDAPDREERTVLACAAGWPTSAIRSTPRRCSTTRRTRSSSRAAVTAWPAGSPTPTA